MPKRDFSKVAKQFYWNHILAWVFSCKFAALFQNTSSYEYLWTAASEVYLEEGVFLFSKMADSDIFSRLLRFIA